ncbi:restriction endonuclease [Allostella sp. ATCC 35155]|nr:restriction endonuclease [Stella sp. ATCC 35155]
MSLPPYVPRSLVGERLKVIFPEGTPNRNFCIRELAASTVFTMLYVGAVAGSGVHLAPKHVYRMTDIQALASDPAARMHYRRSALEPGGAVAGHRWYADNTREPIRDETLREGLIPVGAVHVRTDLPTTSSKPRYALDAGFALLFDPDLSGDRLAGAITEWRDRNLSPAALARLAILRLGAASDGAGVLVTFPGRETRELAPGPSSVIAKAVIEAFAPTFLERPAVLWLSESGNKVVARDDRLARAIGLAIEQDRNLPDIVLVDLGPREAMLVFVEVVATDGAVTPRRREAIFALTDAAGFRREQVAFVTAYRDRQAPGFKRTVGGLAWGTFAWFASEPRNLIVLRSEDAAPKTLSAMAG